ncbi:MAG: hypothetical protein R3Y27_04605 [Clostridia bacterium]
MKKEIKSIAIVLSVLIVFLAGVGLGTNKGVNVNIGGSFDVNNSGSDSSAEQTTVATTEATTQSTTAAQADADEEEQTTAADSSSEETTTEAAATSTLPSTTEEIVAKYNEVINNLKAETYVQIDKVQDIEVNITDCSISLATSLIDAAIGAVMAPDTWNRTFTDGVTDDGYTLDGQTYPADQECILEAAGVESATCTENADGTYTLEIAFISENLKFDGTTSTPEMTYNEQALDPINLATFEIPGITITEADMNYPDSTICATINADGKIIEQIVHLPMDGSGTGSISFFSPTVTLDGYADTTFTFSY